MPLPESMPMRPCSWPLSYNYSQINHLSRVNSRHQSGSSSCLVLSTVGDRPFLLVFQIPIIQSVYCTQQPQYHHRKGISERDAQGRMLDRYRSLFLGSICTKRLRSSWFKKIHVPNLSRRFVGIWQTQKQLEAVPNVPEYGIGHVTFSIFTTSGGK